MSQMRISTRRQALAVLVLLLLISPALAGETFTAKITRVVDGDTIEFSTTLLDVTIRGVCRMSGYNAPELSGRAAPEGREAKEKLASLLPVGGVIITTNGKDKYGRWLCEVKAGDIDVNAVMHEHLKNYKSVDRF